MTEEDHAMHIILLSGGSGARLWPLSNSARSKQFLKVLRDGQGKPQSMVQRTFEKISGLASDAQITIATCASQVSSITAQLAGSYNMVIEPERRDTAPAIMLACSYIFFESSASPNDTVVVMPIDTFAGKDYYEKINEIDAAVQSGISDIVLLGATPTYASEKFGYIVPAKSKDPVRAVSCFNEKPSEDTASELIAQGALWNCGIFGFKLGYLLKIVGKYHSLDSYEELYSNFKQLPKNSFDYEVVEKADSVCVISYKGEWKDLGTWNTLSEEMSDDQAGWVLSDKCSNTHIINETGIPMVVSGISDAVVVATPDGILVSTKESSAHIKPLINKIAETRPMYESRQWGEYIVLNQSTFSSGLKSLQKSLIIKAGKQLSYQQHLYRSEIWTIADGVGEVIINNTMTPVKAGSIVSIPSGNKHALRALTDMTVYEVQLGNELSEEDIKRFGYYWNE